MRVIVMFGTAVCVLFLIKLRWLKKINLYDDDDDDGNDNDNLFLAHYISEISMHTILIDGTTTLIFRCH